MKTINEFDLVDHGIEHSQCYRGCRLTSTNFKNIATGIGNNPTEAIDDCLEQIAQAGFEIKGMEARIMEQKEWDALPETPNVIKECEGDEAGKNWYRISIRWNLHKETTMTPQLDEFTQAYFECALWAESDQSNEQGGDPLDENYSIEDIDPDSLREAISDCERFQKENTNIINSTNPHLKFTQAGHDFWLTRNDHGAGFWDGDWPEPAATYLTKASKQFGTVNIYVGDDGKLYFN